jgi:O-acetyl-ADP-ribose deacetylase (regulator of RNase III)
MTLFEAIIADITTLDVDAIVNAANPGLLGGGGVDGAIHAAAGPGLFAECERLPEIEPGVRCPTGEARITGGHLLPARWVIHTVGPVWNDDLPGECDTALRDAYRTSLQIAMARQLRSIAFPAISTGVYDFPAERAAHIAVNTVRQIVRSSNSLERVVFCCFRPRDLATYQHLLRATR